MPSARHAAIPGSGGTAVALSVIGPTGTDYLAAKTTAIISVSVDSQIAFDQSSAANAATAMTTGTASGNGRALLIPAGTMFNMTDFRTDTTYIRAVGTTGGTYSLYFP